MSPKPHLIFFAEPTVLLACLLFAAYPTSRANSQETAPAKTPQEPSVNPGINRQYLQPQTNVTVWVERFEREGREIYDHRSEICDTVKVRAGAAVADIGSGTGLFTLLFAEKAGPLGTVYAVDLVSEFLGHIDQRAKEAGLKNVRTHQCTERSIELPDNSIDLAFICDVYHHFEYPQSSLASIHNALRKDGEIVMVEFKRIPGVTSDWTLNHVRAGQEVFTAEIEKAGFEKVADYDLLKDNYMIRFRKKSKP
ncbi:MAG: class I SAM-dependent methyltransferase [Verrucomicrobia bacterium]|nr:class I SAM-dependent methyltransferase [Verrucomicrobiota bacterium]